MEANTAVPVPGQMHYMQDATWVATLKYTARASTHNVIIGGYLGHDNEYCIICTILS